MSRHEPWCKTLIEHLINAKDHMNLLKQMSNTEIEALPQDLRLTQATINANLVAETSNSSVSS